MGKAMFKIDCPELGFSRSMEIPLDARGYAHQLAEDLTRAMDYYKIRVELHKLKTERLEYRSSSPKECACDARFSGSDEAEYKARGCPECSCR